MTRAAPPHDAARLSGIKLVAIGASAGGVEALGVLLQALPADCRVALAVVLHLAPDRVSRLPDLYGPRCRLTVKEAEDKEPLQIGTVYFAAPDYHMQIEPGRSLSLSRDAAVNFSRPSVDVLLESAAYAYGREMLGIVLTGASCDGAAGLAAVRRMGGLAWVQDPAHSAMPAMPAAALKLAGADGIFSIDEMAAGLARLVSITSSTAT